GYHRPVPAALAAPPPGAALLDARGVQGAGGLRPVAGLQPRRLRPAGALVLPRRPPGDGGRAGRGRLLTVRGARPPPPGDRPGPSGQLRPAAALHGGQRDVPSSFTSPQAAADRVG